MDTLDPDCEAPGEEPAPVQSAPDRRRARRDAMVTVAHWAAAYERLERWAGGLIAIAEEATVAAEADGCTSPGVDLERHVSRKPPRLFDRADAEHVGEHVGEHEEAITMDPSVDWGEPCPDCDGTGWASEANPGTGQGGRDEQIAVECPRGCEPPGED